uniref:F-box domain-containing protein n=1 Tax=Caenorhabditis tropicalis TaxID=1561998 RepID=A0A1I7V493_9PELO
MCVAFPILLLPIVAFREIVRLLDLGEIIKLSLCSRKCKTLVKTQHLRPMLTIGVSHLISITIKRCAKQPKVDDTEDPNKLKFCFVDFSSFDGHVETMYWNFDGHRVPVLQNTSNSYLIYWENSLMGTQTVTSFLTDLFNIRIDRLSLFTREPRVSKKLADLVMSRQDSIQSLVYKVYHNAEEVDYVLDKCKVTDTLILGVPISPNRDIRFRLNKIQLDVPWLTIDNLIEFDCCDILIVVTKLSNQDMNRFLKSWVNGGFPRLRSLSLQLKQVEFEVLTEGLDGTVVRRDQRRPYVLNEKETRWISNSWDIRNNENCVASVHWYDTMYNPNKWFNIVAWPDFNGNPYEL